MATLGQIRQKIADAIETNADVPAWPTIPSSIVPPCVYVRPISQTRETMNRQGTGHISYEFELIVVAALADTFNGQEVLDDLISTGTNQSVVDVFDDQYVLGLEETTVTAEGWGDYTTTTIGERQYMTATIECSVYTRAQ